MNQAVEAVQVPPVVEVAQDPSVAITDLDTFIQLLTAWHAKQVATVQHIYEVPVGTEAVIEGEEPFKMEGDILKGFRLGIDMAMQYLGTLPFTPEYEDVEPVQS